MRELRLTQAFACAKTSMLLALCIIFTLSFSHTAIAQCVPADGTITGHVYLDRTVDGKFDTGEPGVNNVLVTAYDSDGVSVGFGMTNAQGDYLIENLADNAKVRLEFSYPNSYLPGKLGIDNASNVQFTAVPSCNNNLGLLSEANRCSPNPQTLLTCFTFGTTHGSNKDMETIVGLEHDINLNSPVAAYASMKETGSIWGLAWKNSTKEIFSASFVKQYSGLKSGNDAIFRTVYNGTEYETVLFAKLTNLGINVAPLTVTDINDCSYGAQVGKSGLGSMVLSPDEQWLYVINISGNSIVKLSATNPQPETTEEIAIPNPGCSNGDARPFALVFRGDDLYIGVTCTAETSYLNGVPPSQLRLESSANVYKYDTDNQSFNLEFTTNYIKGYWRDDEPDSYRTTHWLTDLDFTDEGNMLLSLSDRLGHKFCSANARVDGQNPDLLIVYRDPTGNWTLENNGAWSSTENGVTTQYQGTGVDNGEGPGNGEFFGDDYWITDPSYHSELALGSIVVLPGSGEVLAAVYDPNVTPYSGGLHRYNTTDGKKVGAKQLYTRDFTTSAGKATGFGNIVVRCGKNPIEIGNYVWNDTNNNGLQDGGENGFANIPLTLLDEACNEIGQTTTDSKGYYVFNTSNVDQDQDGVADGLLPNTNYYVVIGSSIPNQDIYYTIDNEQYNLCGTDDSHSNLTNCDIAIVDDICATNPVIQVTTGGFGVNDHTFDIGLYSPTITDLALRKEALGNGAVKVGVLVDFKISVINQGERIVNTVEVTDYITSAYTFNEDDNPGWSERDGKLVYTITEPIFPSAQSDIFLRLMPVGAQSTNELLNYAEISAATDNSGALTGDVDSQFDSIDDNDIGGNFDTETDDAINDDGTIDEDDHDVAGPNVFDLALKIEDKQENAAYSIGERVEVVISVYNQGLQDAGSFTLINYIPDGLGFDPTGSDGWVLDGNTATYIDEEGIAAGAARKQICMAMRVLSGEAGESLVDRAEILSATLADGSEACDFDSMPDGILGNDNGGAANDLTDDEIFDNGTIDEDDEDPVTISIRSVDIALMKTTATSTAVRGEDIDFDIQVINQGSAPISRVILVDYFPSDLTLNDDEWDQPNPNIRKVYRDIVFDTPLTRNEVYTETVTFRVSPDAAGTPLLNYAEVFKIFGNNDSDISGFDIDSTPDDISDNDAGGIILTTDDNNVSGTRDVEEDDQDPAVAFFVQSNQLVTCGCLGNATTSSNGQFSEVIEINAESGQTWYIDQVTGLFSDTSDAPPASPIAIMTGPTGYTLTETPLGDGTSNYTFSGIRVDGDAYTISFRNENDEIESLSSAACFYEDIIVDGAFSVCNGATETYTVTNPVAGEEYEFDLPEGGEVVSETATSVTIDWDNTVGGPYALEVSNTSMTNANCQSPTTVGGAGVSVGMANGVVSCIGHVNVSLNQNCEYQVRPQTVAAGPLQDDVPYSVMVMMPDGTLIPNNTLNADHLGMEVTVKLIEGCSGNSCWATVTVEDKLAPVIDCQNTEIVCFNFEEYEGPSAIDACDGPVAVDQISENIFVYQCHPEYVRKVTRTYEATDSKGNTSAPCTIDIFVQKIDTADIVYPVDIIGTDALACDEVELDENGFPTLEATGQPMIGGMPIINSITPLCNIAMDYKDRLVGPIGCTTKVMREFRLVFNTCEIMNMDSIPMTQIFKYTQTIELEDNNPPVFGDLEDINASAGSGNCQASVFIPAPSVTDACSDEIEIDIRYPGGFFDNQSSGFVTLPSGSHTVTYLAYDECGNLDSASINVVVMDNTAPVVVCDVPTAIGLASNGVAYAYANVFDDGSTDACGIDYMQVRRVDMAASCGPESTTFGDFVVFCCEDVGQDIMVELQVVDFAGNANSCMVSVQVQDKFAPMITVPADLTIECGTDYDLEDLSEYGSASATDACMAVITESAVFAASNTCGEGVITRTFTATDGSDSVSDTQTITIINTTPFVRDNISFPPDYDAPLNICSEDALLPENIPAPFNLPVLTTDECDMVAMTYTDEIFDFTDGSNACYKILRTFTVINWCVMVDGTPETFVDEQVIKVSNNIAPTINESCEALSQCTFDNDCESGFISLTKTASDDCTEDDNLQWSYIIDFGVPGMADLVNNGSGNEIDASGEYPVGDHTITYTFMDRCGNPTSCIQEFSIVVCTPPQAVCIDGLIVELVPMDVDGDGVIDAEMACLFAPQLDASSSHDCGLPIVFSFSADTTFVKDTFDCSNIGVNEVTLWVTDINGNTDICVTTLTVQDNNDVDLCPSIEDCVVFPTDTTIVTCNADLAPAAIDAEPVVDTDCAMCDDFDVLFTDDALSYPNDSCGFITRNFVVTFNCFNSPMTVEGSHTISVLDVLAPDITSPADVTADANNPNLDCAALIVLDDAIATSNCNSTITITNDSPFAFEGGANATGNYPVGTTTVTFTATDPCGNSSFDTTDITITDAVAPVCNLQDITINVDSDGTATIDFGDVDDGSFDACGGDVISVSITPNEFDCSDIGDNIITTIISDSAGNTTVCIESIVTVTEFEAPNCEAQDITVSILEGTTSVSITPSQIDNGSSDACSAVTLISVVPDTFTCSDLGENIVVLTVGDSEGNTSTCTATVTVDDLVAPTCNAGIVNVTLDDNGTVTIDGSLLDDGSTDDCGTIVDYSVEPNMFDCTNLGSNNVILTVTDDNGNTSSCSGIVIIDEDTPPMCVTQDITVTITDSGVAVTITPDQVDDGSMDACGTASLVSVVPNSFDCTNLGDNIVVLTVSDQDGNTSTCTATVTVDDVVAPNCSAGTVTVTLDDNGTVIIDGSLLDNGSTDDCGTIVDFSVDPNMFDCTDLGSNTVILTVTDDNGNTSSCSGTVIIEENTPPLCMTQDITVTITDSGVPVTITPDQVDDGSMDACGSANLVSVMPNSFDCTNLGDNIVVLTVSDQDGNTSTCTATVTVDDVVAPNCNAGSITVSLDDNLPVTIDGIDLDNGSTDDCGTVVSYSVDPDTFTCDDLGTNTVILTVTDDNGNTSSCEGTVIVEDVEAPICMTKDTIIALDPNGTVVINATAINDGSFDECGTLQSIVVEPFSFNCDDIGDNVVTLTTIDNSGNSSTCTAIVTIVDETAPECVAMDITVSLTSSTGITITGADVDGGSTDDCGMITSITVDPDTFDCDDIGDNIVTVTTTDDSNNTSTCTATVTVTDDTLPECLTNDITVSLDATGTATITPEDVDAGSSSGCNDDVTLSLDQTQFFCNDSSFPFIEVTLTVTSNTTGEMQMCTANVTIIDDQVPEVTCPADVSVDCADFTGDLNDYGSMDDLVVVDNCLASITTEMEVDTMVNECGIGTYTRTFTVTDIGDNTASCTQIVTVELGDNFLIEEDLTFPEDTLFFGDCNSIDPANIPVDPVVIDSMAADCFNVSITTVDTGMNPDSPCNDTITRSYTVIDICQEGTGAGVFTFDQTIIINDTTAPIITGPQDTTIMITDTSTCLAILDLSDFSVDNCDANFTVTNDSPFADDNMSGDASGSYPVGEYEITLTATDNCNNSSTYTYNVNVLDTLIIDFVCLKIEPPMEADLSVDVMAIDLIDTLTFFDCAGTVYDTIVSFSPIDPDDNVMAFGCEAVIQPVETRIYLFIDGELVDSCRGTVQLMDPNDLCMDGLVANVFGSVFTEQNQPVPGVYVDMDGSGLPENVTDTEGKYAFNDMPTGGAYDIIPVKDDNPLEGVTTLDLILIQRHILGLSLLDSPYKIVAADIDANDKLSGLDIIQLRKLILGIYEEFPANTSWRMIDSKYDFFDAENPLDEYFPESYDIESLASNMKIDFVGVKVGDVNGSYDPNDIANNESDVRSNQVMTLIAEDRQVSREEEVSVELMVADEMDLQGLQTTLYVDGGDQIEITSELPGFGEDNYSIDSRGNIAISWNSIENTSINERTAVIRVSFVSGSAGLLSEMVEINSDVLVSESYSNNSISTQGANILWSDLDNDIALFQNNPNPWTESTEINFTIPKAGEVTINIRSANGQRVKSYNGYYTAGLHNVTVSKEDIVDSGVYYYIMRYDNQVVVKKMILVK